jgi:hypothetical protein
MFIPRPAFKITIKVILYYNQNAKIDSNTKKKTANLVTIGTLITSRNQNKHYLLLKLEINKTEKSKQKNPNSSTKVASKKRTLTLLILTNGIKLSPIKKA